VQTAIRQLEVVEFAREELAALQRTAGFATYLSLWGDRGPGIVSKVDGELQDLMGTYGSDPEFQELCDGLKDMASQIHSGCQAQQDYADKQAQYSTDAENYKEAWGRVLTFTASAADYALIEKGVPQAPTAPGPQVYDDGQMQSWDTLISDKTDVTGKNDQLTMIHIQELKATLDQSSQLGSTFISSGDKTSSAIINNIA